MSNTSDANRILRTAHPALWRQLSTSDRAVAREVLAYCERHHRLGLVARHPTLAPVWGGGVIYNVSVEADLRGAWRAYASSEAAARTIIALVRHAARDVGIAA